MCFYGKKKKEQFTFGIPTILADAVSNLFIYLFPTGLAGQTPVEQALADAVVDTIDDFMTLFPWAEKNQDTRVRQSLI